MCAFFAAIVVQQSNVHPYKGSLHKGAINLQCLDIICPPLHVINSMLHIVTEPITEPMLEPLIHLLVSSDIEVQKASSHALSNLALHGASESLSSQWD